MSTKFPYCCAALTAAADADMLIAEGGLISWFTGRRNEYGNQFTETVTECPFCGAVEDSAIFLEDDPCGT